MRDNLKPSDPFGEPGPASKRWLRPEGFGIGGFGIGGFGIGGLEPSSASKKLSISSVVKDVSPPLSPLEANIPTFIFILENICDKFGTACAFASTRLLTAAPLFVVTVRLDIVQMTRRLRLLVLYVIECFITTCEL